jgi:hypothetical protein
MNIFQSCDAMTETIQPKEFYSCFCVSIKPKAKSSGLKDGPFMNYFEFLEAVIRSSEFVKVEKMTGS